MKRIPYEWRRQLPRGVQLERMHRVIRQELTRRERETLMAYYFEEQNIPQIARAQKINKSTVSRTLRRAEERLGRFLQY